MFPRTCLSREAGWGAVWISGVGVSIDSMCSQALSTMSHRYSLLLNLRLDLNPASRTCIEEEEVV